MAIFQKKTKEKQKFTPSEIKTQGLQALYEFVAPPAIDIQPNSIQIGKKLARTFFVFSYPRYLETVWLSPIINLNRIQDIALFLQPTNTAVILKNLTKQLARVEAEIREREQHGLVRSPILETAHKDIEDLRDKLQQGKERFFLTSLYITIYADTIEELDDREVEMRSLFENYMVQVKIATLQQKQGFSSTLPLGQDELRITTQMNTAPLSTTFPFVSADLSSDKGILYGINRHNNSLILFDRFSLENANTIIFGKSGGGKTIHKNEKVLCNINGQTSLTKIGELIEKLAKKYGITRINKEMEGVIFPPNLKVYSFNKNMKGEWSTVTVAMRKKAPKMYYKIKTRSGREITTTGDHNMIICQNGKIKVAKTSEVKEGEFIPLPRQIQSNSPEYPPKLTNNTSLFIAPELLTLAGLITAEGNITDSNIYISNIDPKILKIIASAWRKLGIRYKKSINKKTGQVRGIVVCNKPLAKALRALGGGGLSAQKKVWPFIFSLGKQNIARYLAAYFEGDGGVELWKSKQLITTTSKSKELISGICYLLYYFGIIARISKIRKKPTNSNWERKRTYWKLTISGEDNLKRFQKEISFLGKKKNNKLARTLARGIQGNTNVDIIPELTPYFETIYQNFGFALNHINNGILRPLKHKKFLPSRQMLRSLIKEVEAALANYEETARQTDYLETLPELEYLTLQGAQNKNLNHQLWKGLGTSWQLMKQGQVAPMCLNVFKAAEILTGSSYDWFTIKTDLRRRITNTGIRLTRFSPTTKAYLIDRPNGNARYHIVKQDIKRCRHLYQLNQSKIYKTKQALIALKLFANSQLFWDPIAKIQKIKNSRDKYVYDLTVDNEVFLAGQGGMFVHNSYLAKLEILRSLMFGADVIVIDPENEYQYLAETVGGTFFRISLTSEHHLNPFDLPPPLADEDPAQVLRQNIIDLVGIFKVMLGGVTPKEDALLDEAVTETYAARDITTSTPEYWQKTPPRLQDLQEVLESIEGAEEMAAKFQKYTKGRFAGFFNQQSNVDINNFFVVFNIRDMEEQLRPTAMYIILNYIWKRIRRQLKKRLLFIDEAWWLMRHAESGEFLLSISKRARKYYLGLTTITQDLNDFLKSPYGEPIITNSSLQILFKQSPATVDLVQGAFQLTEEEKLLLLQSTVGQGIFFAGLKHAAMEVVASYSEDQVITSDPEQLLKIEAAKKELAQSETAEAVSQKLESRS